MPKPLLSARYRVVVRDPKGRIKYIEEAPSKSFILNLLYWWWLCFNLNESDVISVVNTSGRQTTQTLSQPMGWTGITGGTAPPYSGVQVGSGTSAPSASSPYLESLIVSGTSPGQLSYGTNDVTSPSLSSNPGTIQDTKTFTNNSGGTVTVGEIGLAIQANNGITDTHMAALIIHDVLSSPVHVVSGGTLTVTYTMEVNT